MIPIYFLVFICVFFLIIEIMLLQLDYVSPCFIYTASFTVCAFFCNKLSITNRTWDIEFIYKETFFFIVVSIVLFIVIEQIIRSIFVLSKGNELQSNNKEIYVSDSILKVAIIILILGIALTMIMILSNFGGGNWNKMMEEYKYAINTSSSIFGIGKKILNQVMKCMTALEYCLLYIFCNNLECNSLQKRQQHLYISTFILYVIFRVMITGSRQTMMFFIVAIFTIIYILKTTGKKRVKIKKEKRKYLVCFAIVFCVILVSFYYMGIFLGRKTTDVLYAAEAYLAEGIYGLNCEIRDSYRSTYWGEISFPQLYPLLKFLNILPNNLEAKGWLPFFRHGNTVTLLGRWYWDFGVVGTYIILLIIIICFCTIYYGGIKYSKQGNRRNIMIILYAQYIHILYFAGYDDFTVNVWALVFVMTVTLTVLAYYFIVCRQLRLRYKNLL